MVVRTTRTLNQVEKGLLATFLTEQFKFSSDLFHETLNLYITTICRTTTLFVLFTFDVETYFHMFLLVLFHLVIPGRQMKLRFVPLFLMRGH